MNINLNRFNPSELDGMVCTSEDCIFRLICARNCANLSEEKLINCEKSCFRGRIERWTQGYGSIGGGPGGRIALKRFLCDWFLPLDEMSFNRYGNHQCNGVI